MAKQENIGSPELERVKKKAMYNYRKRLRDQEEEKRFKESLESGNPFLFDNDEVEDNGDSATQGEDAKKGKK